MDQQIIVYKSPDGSELPVKTDGETVWLTQRQMCQLFGRDRTVITKHINNIFKEGELVREVVCAKFAHTTFLSNSPSLKTLFICLPITVLSFWNNSAICACDSQTVSLSIFTSRLVAPSAV